MTRGRRPHFGPSDQDALLEAMGDARHRANLCAAASGFGSPRWNICHEMTGAIDALAEELTGNRELFHDRGTTGPSRMDPVQT